MDITCQVVIRAKVEETKVKKKQPGGGAGELFRVGKPLE